MVVSLARPTLTRRDLAERMDAYIEKGQTRENARSRVVEDLIAEGLAEAFTLLVGPEVVDEQWWRAGHRLRPSEMARSVLADVRKGYDAPAAPPALPPTDSMAETAAERPRATGEEQSPASVYTTQSATVTPSVPFHQQQERHNRGLLGGKKSMLNAPYPDGKGGYVILGELTRESLKQIIAGYDQRIKEQWVQARFYQALFDRLKPGEKIMDCMTEVEIAHLHELCETDKPICTDRAHTAHTAH
jgi:hypothetical protein